MTDEKFGKIFVVQVVD